MYHCLTLVAHRESNYDAHQLYNMIPFVGDEASVFVNELSACYQHTQCS